MRTFLGTSGTDAEKGQTNAQVASPRKRCHHQCRFARARSWDCSSGSPARRLPRVRGVYGCGGTHVGPEPAPAWTGGAAANTVRRHARGSQGVALRLGTRSTENPEAVEPSCRKPRRSGTFLERATSRRRTRGVASARAGSRCSARAFGSPLGPVSPRLVHEPGPKRLLERHGESRKRASRHASPQRATPLRTPWRFKSSHPHT